MHTCKSCATGLYRLNGTAANYSGYCGTPTDCQSGLHGISGSSPLVCDTCPAGEVPASRSHFNLINIYIIFL